MIVKVVLRNLKKRPFLNLIKIIGLSLALTCIVSISLFLKNELTYDRHHSNAAQVYRLTTTNPKVLGGKHFARTFNSSIVKELKDQVPAVEEYLRLEPVKGGIVKYDKMNYNLLQGFICDSTFFKVFDASLIFGNKESVLEHQASMLMSESFAEKLFGDESPIGKIVSIPSGQYYEKELTFTVNGVMKDFPPNSHFHPDFIATPPSGWQIAWAWTYLKMADKSNMAASLEKINHLVKETGDIEFNKNIEAYLQPLLNIHLYSNKYREIEPNGNITNVYVLAIAAIILLFIAISNYANLSIGMAGFSNKLLFVNQILGSSTKGVLKYFASEGIIIVSASIVLSILILFPVSKVLEDTFGLHLFDNSAWFLLIIVTGFMFLSVLSGTLPVLTSVHSFFKKSHLSNINYKGKAVSRSLVIFQYAVSITLIVAVIVITRQTNFALSKGLGMADDNIFCFESVHANVQDKFEVFKEELIKHHSIEKVSAMLEPPGGEANDMFPFEMEGYNSQVQDKNTDKIGVFPCDHSFASLFDLNFIGGKNFSSNNKDNEGSGEYIINRSAMHRLNYTNADELIGKEFKLNFMYPGIEIPKGKIIGVVEDFNLSSIKSKIEPLVLFKRKNMWLLNFVVAYKPEMKKQAMQDIQTVWNSLYPNYPLQYEHITAMYNKVYKTEVLQSKLLSIFTIVALIICSMGLLGISLLITQYRVKEIGIRKVNGAKVSEVLTMLNIGFVKWIAIAFGLACPIAYYTMGKWLESFAYKTELSWWIFALAGVIALGIALITVSWQSWKAATRNPVEALRYE
ncbi:ABC transporter permease [Labilibacter marinus]|uniref:ABC transporter permease n=1 Tax=Labilibacter marinus TaxID=1477105 RepID=UPI00082BA587|nr:ABC transporter permease [Labilibacter marinus]